MDHSYLDSETGSVKRGKTPVDKMLQLASVTRENWSYNSILTVPHNYRLKSSNALIVSNKLSHCEIQTHPTKFSFVKSHMVRLKLECGSLEIADEPVFENFMQNLWNKFENETHQDRNCTRVFGLNKNPIGHKKIIREENEILEKINHVMC